MKIDIDFKKILNLPNKPNENGTLEENKQWLINFRNAALDIGDFQIAVAISHSIAWLGYLIELEKKLDIQE